MENKPTNLYESLWRRKLSDAEREMLRAQPELEPEAQLTRTLTDIPDVSVPSNFTTRVLQAVKVEEAGQSRRQGRLWNWHRLWPRVAIATTVVILAGVSIQHYETNSRRLELAKSVAQIAAKQPMPSMDALKNLDVIQKMGASIHADGELLAALQ